MITGQHIVLSTFDCVSVVILWSKCQLQSSFGAFIADNSRQ